MLCRKTSNDILDFDNFACWDELYLFWQKLSLITVKGMYKFRMVTDFYF